MDAPRPSQPLALGFFQARFGHRVVRFRLELVGSRDGPVHKPGAFGQANGSKVWDNVSILAAPTAVTPARRAGTPALMQVGNRILPAGAGELVVRDLSGRVILSRRVSGESSLELSSLPRGIFSADFRGARVLVRQLEL